MSGQRVSDKMSKTLLKEVGAFIRIRRFKLMVELTFASWQRIINESLVFMITATHRESLASVFSKASIRWSIHEHFWSSIWSDR